MSDGTAEMGTVTQPTHHRMRDYSAAFGRRWTLLPFEAEQEEQADGRHVRRRCALSRFSRFWLILSHTAAETTSGVSPYPAGTGGAAGILELEMRGRLELPMPLKGYACIVSEPLDDLRCESGGHHRHDVGTTDSVSGRWFSTKRNRTSR